MNLICGTYFKHKCRLQLSHYKDARTPEFAVFEDTNLNNNYVFCKPEYLSTLSTYSKIGAVNLPDQFNLVTHNSDINFGENEIKFVFNLFPNIQHWYTQNLIAYHDKVFPIPIGIANPKWSHGNQERFNKTISKNINKENNVYINFNVSTNPAARNDCLNKLGSKYPFQLQKKYPNAASIKNHDDFVESTQEKYLEDIASSWFTVSPVGNGVDCHKTWEALYMRSIPIVTRWHGAERFKEMNIPILIIDDWSEFKNLKLTKNLYDDLWGDFDPYSLEFSTFIKND